MANLSALHEVIGHGSGKLSPRLKSGSELYLKEYYSTMEEGQADLSALWNIWDPKLKQLDLVEGDQDEVANDIMDKGGSACPVECGYEEWQRAERRDDISAERRAPVPVLRLYVCTGHKGSGERTLGVPRILRNFEVWQGRQ